MRKIITYGMFDLLYVDRFRLLERARSFVDELILGSLTDSFNRLKHKSSFYFYEIRREILESISYVDKVIPEENWEQKVNDVMNHNVNVFVIGNDWKGEFDFLKDVSEVNYLPRTEGVSSTQIKETISSEGNK